MNYISMPAPIKFHQVKEDNLTLEKVAERFEVHPKNIERDHAQEGPLQKGEMLVIKVT